jgi:CheY-like chemotaxis protein
MEPEVFTAQVADAFNHLYDLVYLRTHPLADFVTPEASVPAKKKAWLLHDVLLGLIEELDPGFHAPADGREKRRYRLLSMRYSEGNASKAVADALAISLRHYYREHDTAIEAVAMILWERYQPQRAEASTLSDLNGTHGRAPANVQSTEEPLNRQAMLRAEAAHFHDFGQKTDLGEVLPGVIALAREMARVKGIRLTLEPLPDVPPLPVDRTMIRQILLGVLSYLDEQLAAGEIVVRVRMEDQQQIVEMVGMGRQMPTATVHLGEEQLATLYELAGLQSAQLEPLTEASAGREPQAQASEQAGEIVGEKVGFRLRLPRAPRRTVLLIDDNLDILELYQRYLQQRHYQAVTVQGGAEALRLASQLQPQAIVLDLMMPEQDGWEILQWLTNHPDTHKIPVVICSILRARQLAMALGAAAFLEKPVDETEFLGVLDTLTAR